MIPLKPIDVPSTLKPAVLRTVAAALERATEQLTLDQATVFGLICKADSFRAWAVRLSANEYPPRSALTQVQAAARKFNELIQDEAKAKNSAG